MTLDEIAKVIDEYVLTICYFFFFAQYIIKLITFV